MYTWKTDPDRQLPNILDHASDFRLKIAADQDSYNHVKSWWTVLIEIEGISINEFIALASEYTADLLVPVAYDASDRKRVLSRQPVMIFARPALIEALNQSENRFHVVSFHLGASTPEEYLDFNALTPDLSKIEIPQYGVVVAVVDYGIAIAHDLFRKDLTSSRIEHASIFGAKPVADGRCSVGRALTKKQVDKFLQEFTYSELLDEEAFYRATGLVDWASVGSSPVAHQASHGTHVVGLAAGHPMADACENRPIICASLPSQLVEDTTGLASLPTLYLAFHTLIKQAQRFVCSDKKPAPVVFNFSFGNSGGPHDGTGLFSTLLEFYFGEESECVTKGHQIWLTLPAGNLNLGRLHATTQKDPKTHLDLTVMQDDETPSMVQIWGPNEQECDNVSEDQIRVETPSGETARIEMLPGQASSLCDEGGAEIARLACQYVKHPTARRLTTLSIRATSCADGTQVPTAPAGIWSIDLERESKDVGPPLEIRIRRDEALLGTRSGGRQAWFSNPDYQRFDRFGAPLATDPNDSECVVRRSGSISGFACGDGPIVVAAFTQRDASLSNYSGSGPLTERGIPPIEGRDSPDLAAKGDESFLLRGVISAGSSSGSWTRFSGTSAAAPRVARAATEHIHHWNGTGREWSANAVKQFPFALRDDKTNNSMRAGAGGTEIPIKNRFS